MLIGRCVGQDAPQGNDEQQDSARDLQLGDVHVEQVDQTPVADQGEDHDDEQGREDRQVHDVAPLAILQLAGQIDIDRDVADRIDDREQQQTVVNDQAERARPVSDPPLGRIPNAIQPVP